MKVSRWLGRRLLMIAVLLVGVSVLVFGLLQLTPGSPEQILLGARPTSPQALAAVRADFHLDESFLAQYWRWLTGALHLDFGRSIRTGQPVADVLAERLPITLFLSLYAFLLVAVIAIPLGLVSGIRNGTMIDRAATLISTFGVSAPAFAVGILLLYVFGVALGWFPVYGPGTGFTDRLWHLTLPAITLSLSVIAVVSRQTRAAALTVYNEDFVTFARGRGLPRRLIWGRYALRNSSLPVATSMGMVFAYFLTGSVIVEQTFALPGIGELLVGSVSTKDIPVVQALALLAAVVVLVLNLVADLLYPVLDPRVRKSVFG
ncbi:ABC transporter permease [Actinocrispum wychmicini]|uniref:Peptide/nickel transport system permease protein n=1 Tax=Actinocrispum wychmicini TaxID=1213861 RepID=A0A4R2J8T4_9PSEU|nr:ABC transporter permease [Actinocrispum wychmicini]TCO54172.1 peptide/nickel transport system permease protein [Actinocrispum wychmicini]